MTQFTIHFTDGTSTLAIGHYIGEVHGMDGWFRIMQHEVSEKTGKPLSGCHEVVRFNGTLVKSIESSGFTNVELVGSAPV